MSTPFEDIMQRLENPENNLTEEQKNNLKSVTNDVGSVVKSSLISLLLGQFNKVATYESAAQSIIQQLSERAVAMETDELISFLSVLAKANAMETKTIMDMFKKNENDVGKIVKEIQKISKPELSEKPVIDITSSSTVLSAEKQERILRFLEKQKNEQ